MAHGDPGAWQVSAPCPVGEVGSLLSRLRAEAAGAAAVLGVDAPIGVPRAYAARHATAWPDFPAFLRGLADRRDFFAVCPEIGDVGPGRPFYPDRAARGMTRAAHAAALGLPGPAALLRACDHATADRPAGAPPFWTLGANQSGKAGISAWRDLLLPALRDGGQGTPALWPFDGQLRALLRPGGIAVAETYPAEALRQLGLRMAGSKRRQADRAALGSALLGAMTGLGAVPDVALLQAVAAGFGGDAAGEDRFDCVLGLLCLLGVLAGRQPDVLPEDPWVRRWEGWVLGQAAPLPLLRSSLPDSTPRTRW